MRAGRRGASINHRRHRIGDRNMSMQKFRIGCLAAVAGAGILGTGVAAAQQTPISVLQQFVRSQSGQSVAVAVGTLCPPGNRLTPRLQQDCNALVGAAFGGDTAVATALGQITPDNVNASFDRSQIHGGFSRAPGGAGLLGGAVLGATGQDEGEIAFALLPSVNGAAYAANGDFGAWSVFAHLDFADYGRDASVNEDGFDADRQAVTVGVERRFSDRVSAGVAFGLGRDDLELTASSGGQDIDEQRLLAYLSWNSESGWYADALVNFQTRDIEQERRVAYQLGSGVAVDQRFSADYDGDVTSLAATLGRRWQRDAMGIDPYVGLEFSSLDVDGYAERASSPDAAGAGWAIVSPDNEADLTTADFGIRLDWARSSANGVWVPQVDLAYVRVLDQSEDDTPVFFAGDLSPAQQLAIQEFAMVNDDEDEDYFRAGFGIVGQWANGRSGFINIAKRFGDDRHDLTELTLGFRIEF
jgi:outer membrane autotransporter protein